MTITNKSTIQSTNINFGAIMKQIRMALLFSSLFLCIPGITVAGAGHDHGHSHAAMSETEVQTKATQKIKHLIKTGKIDTNWSHTKLDNITQKDYGQGLEWVITFKNDKVSDVTKQTLYLFYTQDGHYLAANFDGS